jgi:hypothetical protein
MPIGEGLSAVEGAMLGNFVICDYQAQINSEVME